jgi:CheY-like chemotaxis protein
MDDDLDFLKHFSAAHKVPEPGQSEAALRDVDQLGEIGLSDLKDRGYFTRIVVKDRESGGKRPLPEKLRVLIVEDDASTAALIEKVLITRGCQTRRAANLPEIANGLAEKPGPDLVLLDVMLPGVSGFDVLNRIRQHPRLEKMPVLMLTSLGTRKDVARGLVLGATGYITKPVLPSTLIEAIEAAVAS